MNSPSQGLQIFTILTAHSNDISNPWNFFLDFVHKILHFVNFQIALKTAMVCTVYDVDFTLRAKLNDLTNNLNVIDGPF